MSTSFHLLSRNLQQTVWKKGWTSLTDIQNRAIPAIVLGESDVVIASETASGKTEAAFLPILSLVENQAPDQLKVLYISPLKALINDQFQRVQELCDLSAIPVHRWHGDVSQSAKKQVVKNPSGILQITPESLESLFINRTLVLRQLMEHISFVVIDEVHAFFGTERGTQLRSLLSRVAEYTVVRPRLVALSATIGDKEYARCWLRPDDPEHVEVVEGAPSGKETRYSLFHLSRDQSGQVSVELFEDMRDLTRSLYGLIFCNAKAAVEETSVFLNRLAEREKAGRVYLTHHANISATEREFAERTILESKTPKSIVATSTLELGIDIGQIDLVIQVDSTFSVASLKQRLGRSGRRPGASRMFQLYSTTTGQLLQSLAVTELFLQDWVEEPRDYSVPLDILWHQIISLCAECNGLSHPDLLRRLRANGAFAAIADQHVKQIVLHMIKQDHLEQVAGSGELIVGVEGERVLRSRDFYAVFATPVEYSVLHKAQEIGTLPQLPLPYRIGNTVILAGRLWILTEVDEKRFHLYVEPASSAQKPQFLGSAAGVHHRIRTEMARIVTTTGNFSYLGGTGQETLESVRTEFRALGIGPNDRGILIKDGKTEVRAFVGDRILCTLLLMLKQHGEIDTSPGPMGWFTVKGLEPADVRDRLLVAAETHFEPLELARLVGSEIASTKFGYYLPLWAKQEMFAASEIDVPSTHAFLRSVQWKIV